MELGSSNCMLVFFPAFRVFFYSSQLEKYAFIHLYIAFLWSYQVGQGCITVLKRDYLDYLDLGLFMNALYNW